MNVMTRCTDMYALVMFYAEAMQLTLQSFDPETCVIQTEKFIIQKFWFDGVDVVFTMRGSGDKGMYANIVDSKGEIEKNTNFKTLDEFKEMIPALFRHCLRSRDDFVFKFPVGPTLVQMKENVESFLAARTTKTIDFEDHGTFISFSVKSPLYTDEKATSIRIKGTSTDELASWTQYVGSVEKIRTPFVSLKDFEKSISTLLMVSQQSDSQSLTSIDSKLETIIGMLKKIDGRIDII